MIKINLLPVRQIIRRRQTRKQVFILLICFSVVLTGMGITGIILAQKISGLKKEVAILQQKKDSYQPMLNEIDQLKKDKAILERKLSIINSLKTGRLTTVKVMDEIATRTPVDRLWLKTLNQTNGKLTLSGVALDNATIAEYMKALDESPLLGGVELASASQMVFAGKKLKSFSLTLTIVTPDTPNNTTAQGNK